MQNNPSSKVSEKRHVATESEKLSSPVSEGSQTEAISEELPPEGTQQAVKEKEEIVGAVPQPGVAAGPLRTESLHSPHEPVVESGGDDSESGHGHPPELPVTDPIECSPTSSILAAVKRVLCDPSVSSGVSQLLREKNGFEKTVQTALTKVVSAFSGRNAVAAKAEPCRGTVLIEFRQLDGSKTEALSQEVLQRINLRLIDKDGNLAAGDGVVGPGAIRFQNVEAGEVLIAFQAGSIAEAATIDDKYEVSQGAGKFKPFDRKMVPTKWPGFGTTGEGPFPATVVKGEETVVRLTLKPKVAMVRCFSALQAEAVGCTEGKRYVSQISINAIRGGHLVECRTTNDAGCSAFKLSPGWYTFSAPQDVAIDGCNYTLATSSPIAALVGAGQTCSDLVFYYKRKGNSISVSTSLSRPDVGDPKVIVTEDMAGMTYLLLREGDPSFSAQLTATDTKGVVFSGLPAGTYLLFFISPHASGPPSMRPVDPPGGRLVLTLFNGQTSSVPVRGHFITVPTAKPAVLNGQVEDNGKPVFQQIVRAVNQDGSAVAAALTDESGLYSMLIYDAADLWLEVGSQQKAVARRELETAMRSAVVRSTMSGVGLERVLQEPLLTSSS
jgi:hypothetical protein